jgi:uncharacterized protein
MFILLIVFFLIDLYIFQGIKTLTSTIDSDTTRKVIHGAFWTINILFMLFVAYAFLSYDRAKGMKIYQIWAFNGVILMLVPKLVFAFILLGQDAVRLFATGVNYALKHQEYGGNDIPNPFGTEGGYMPDRRIFISQLGLGLAAIPFAGIIYGILKGKYDYTVHRHTVFFKDLPDAFDGLTITQLSDIHAGSFDNPEAVKRGVALANAQKSDLLFFTGDLVNNEATEIEPYLDIFKVLEAPLGKFSVLGNHDYGDYKWWRNASEKSDNMVQLKKHHKTLGFKLLLDENLEIERNGQKITLIGVENWGHGFAQYGDLSKAMTGVAQDSFKILLSHDPTHWEKQVKTLEDPVHLTLSGHTHGAQMGVEIKGFKWSPIKYRYPKWAGLYEENGRYLHINRGFGFLAFSGRVGILPEISVLELKKG